MNWTDYYNVKARFTAQAFEIIAMILADVAASFRKCCRQSWAIIGEELARNGIAPQHTGGGNG